MHNDFRALGISHNQVIDTAEVFKNPKTGQGVNLRKLAQTKLGKNIQQMDGISHDPAEDAITCIQLMKHEIEENSQSNPHILPSDGQSQNQSNSTGGLGTALAVTAGMAALAGVGAALWTAYQDEDGSKEKIKKINN